MSSFRKALLWTAIPSMALSIIGAVMPLAWPRVAWASITGFIVAIVFLIRGKKQIAAGVLAGLGIGIIVFFLSCFVAVFVPP